MKNLVLIMLVMSIYSVSAQESILRFPVNLNEDAGAFSIVDEESGNFAIIIKDRRTLYGFLFDKDFNEISTVEIEKLPARYLSLAGTFKNSEELQLLFANQNRNKFAIASINFEAKTGNFEKLDLRLRKEGFIGAFSYPEKFSILSIPLGSDVIRLYELEKDAPPVVKEMNFENQEFLNKNNRPVKMYEAFSENEDFLQPGIMKTDRPNSLIVSSKKIKFYEFDDEVVISIDTNNFFTFLLNINPTNLAVTVNSIEKPQLDDRKTSNSLVYNDKLIQTVVNKKGLALQFYDLSTEAVIKKFSTREGREIFFKNTPITQHKDLSSSPENIENQKFFRKISDHVGITALQQKNLHHISLGAPFGSSEEESVDLNFVVLNSTESDFSEGFSANDYALSRTIEFTGLFNENFEHVEGNTGSDFFQKIRSYAREQEDIHTETVFSKNGELFWGFFSSKNLKYQILRID